MRNRLSFFIRIFRFAILTATLAGCSTMSPIATETDYENFAATANIANFRVEFEDMPEFLKPMLRDEASIILASKGLDYTEGDAHAILLLSFVQRTVSSDDVNKDEFSGSLSPGGDIRFIVEVHLKLNDSVSGELIWSGMMSRYHSVVAGSYMHDAPARAAMRQAFADVFENYPDPTME